MTTAADRRAVVVFGVAAGASVALSAWIAFHRAILVARYAILVELGAWSLAWVVATVAAVRLPRRWAPGLVLGAALAVRLVALGGPPSTSDDLFRYSWDGRVQAAGVDPYAEPPDSPALVRLREGWLWPDAAGCAEIRRPPGCTRINRPADRTIYPPVAEAWFAGVYRVAGVGTHHKGWQVAGLVTDMGVVALLTVALRRWGSDPRWAALYALCPAPVIEVVNNGHVDGLAVLLVVAALVVAVPPPVGPGRAPKTMVGALVPTDPAGGLRDGQAASGSGSWASSPTRGSPSSCRGGVLSAPWRDVAAGALVGAAALVKLYPGLLLVALVGVPQRRRLPVLVRAGATATALSVLTYLPHVCAVGPKVLGYLPGYLREEHYDKGGRFLLAGAVGVPSRWAGPISVLVVGAAAAWVLARRPPAPRGAALLLGALFLAATPVQPWYAVSVVAVAAVATRPSWVAVAVAGYPYFFAVILDNRHVVGIGRLAYGAAVVAVAAVAFIRVARRRGWGQGSRSWRTESAVPAATT